jgi:stress response protein YsnF
MSDRQPPLPAEPLHVVTDGAPVRLSVVEEQVTVSATQHETGAVRVRKVVHEDFVDVPVTLRSEHVDVRHVPENRRVDSEYGPRQVGDTWIVPVFEYVPVTEMRLMLKEEVHITRRTVEKEVIHTVPVRKDTLIVERRHGPAGEWVPEPPVPTTPETR